MSGLLFPVLAGITITMQNSLNGLMTPYLGAIATSFAGFVIQVVLLLAICLLTERRLPDLRRVSPVCYAGGLAAVIIVGLVGYCVSQMGSAVTSCCSVAGQIMMSAAVDHFGLFGRARSRFSRRRVPGFVMILAGVLAMNLIGGEAERASLALLVLAVALGAAAIMVRSINYRATQQAGSPLAGGFVNSLGGMASGLALLFITTGFKPDFGAFLQVPAAYYLAGAFGTATLLCNIMAYKGKNIFYATIFMLIGQVGMGILMDAAVFHMLSAGKCIGIGVVLAGVVVDKVLVREK